MVAPGGRVAIVVFTREDVASLWYLDYFPSTRAWMEATHPALAAIADELPGADVRALHYTDLCDASLAALADHPEKILEERWRRQTSYFERLGASRPDEMRAGLERLRADVEAGRAPRGGGAGRCSRGGRPHAECHDRSGMGPLYRRESGRTTLARSPEGPMPRAGCPSMSTTTDMPTWSGCSRAWSSSAGRISA